MIPNTTSPTSRQIMRSYALFVAKGVSTQATNGFVIVLSNNASADSLIASLYGLIGVILGIVLSLLPSRLLDARNTAAKHVDILGLLAFEIDVIRQMCADRVKYLDEELESKRLRLPAAADFVDAAWRTAFSAPDFMTTIPKELAEQLAQIYLGVDYLNKVTEQSVLVLTPLLKDMVMWRRRLESGARDVDTDRSAKTAAEQYKSASEAYNRGIRDRAQTLSEVIEDVKPKLTVETTKKRKNLGQYNVVIYTLAGIAAAFVVVLICLLLRAVLTNNPGPV